MRKALKVLWQVVKSIIIGTAVIVVVAAMLLAVTVRDFVLSKADSD
jgi:hypothetical protein